MPLTTGQFFAYVLVGITPTALGRALASGPANPDEWGQAMDADIADGTTIEDAAVVARFHSLLSEYPQIYTALLMPVYQPDPGSPGKYNPTSVGSLLADSLATLGLQPGFLNTSQGWSDPPHPSGTDVLNLIESFSKFDETPRA
ncbi:MAG TPA: hypothetical protein VHU83_06025 [Bryobacteraceae bacterium]|jgi:hypothetical protein|nr:hypothetical protein [Bryobacteraceae bacterium]